MSACVPLSQEQCRGLARRYFGAAIVCDDERLRGRLLEKGEGWMRRSRLWSPDFQYADPWNGCDPDLNVGDRGVQPYWIP